MSEKRISTIAGVTSVVVDLDQKTVEIENNREIKLAEVNSALRGTPYEAAN